MRLNTGRMIHHEVCCLLLSSLESLQTNLEEFSRLLGLETNMPKTENNLVLNNNLKNGFSSLKSSQSSPVKLRLANMSEFAKHIDNEEEFVEVANRSGSTNSILFSFLFGEKSSICLEGKSMTPRRGNTILFHSSQQLPRLCLGPMKGFLS